MSVLGGAWLFVWVRLGWGVVVLTGHWLHAYDCSRVKNGAGTVGAEVGVGVGVGFWAVTEGGVEAGVGVGAWAACIQ